MADGILEYDTPAPTQTEDAGDPNDIYRKPDDPRRKEVDVLARLQEAGDFGLPEDPTDLQEQAPGGIRWESINTSEAEGIEAVMNALSAAEQKVIDAEVSQRLFWKTGLNTLLKTVIMGQVFTSEVAAIQILASGGDSREVTAYLMLGVFGVAGHTLVGKLWHKQVVDKYQTVLTEHNQNGTTT